MTDTEWFRQIALQYRIQISGCISIQKTEPVVRTTIHHSMGYSTKPQRHNLTRTCNQLRQHIHHL